MKIFPENNYSIKLNNDNELVISELKKKTLSKEQCVANWNAQIFIGNIKENEFELKLSKKILGEFCVLNGKLQTKNGTLEIRTSKKVKIIFLAIAIFSFSGVILAILQNKFELILYLALNIFIMRYFFLELGFRFISKSAIKKLTEIKGIEKINNLQNQNI